MAQEFLANLVNTIRVPCYGISGNPCLHQIPHLKDKARNLTGDWVIKKANNYNNKNE